MSPLTEVQICPIGSFLPVDEAGWLINDCRVENVPAALRVVLVDHFYQVFGDALISAYVRGSVARGTAVPGISDLDAFAVVADGTDVACPHLLPDARARFEAAAPGLKEFELDACQRVEVLRSYYSSWAFLVKTQSTCIHGEDLGTLIPPYRVGPHLMAEAMYLPLRLQAYTERTLSDIGPEQARATCQWMMKALVRAAFDLTLDRVGRYTRDLYPCWTTFSQIYPERSQDCERALRWAIAPDDDTAAHRVLIDEFGGWICTEGAGLLQTHGIDPARYEL